MLVLFHQYFFKKFFRNLGYAIIFIHRLDEKLLRILGPKYIFNRYKKFKYVLVMLLLGSFIKTEATHLVGGELYYDYLWPGTYRITLKLFRDCVNGQQDLTSSDVIVHVWNKNKTSLLAQVLMGAPTLSYVTASTNNPCMQSPNGVCTEVGVYTKTVSLPLSPGGHVLRFSGGLRNANSLNIKRILCQGLFC